MGLSLFLFSTFSLFSQTTYTIDDVDDLEDLVETLAAGDTVILADGTYTTDDRIKFSPTTGTAEMPITFRAETPGGVIFTGGLKMSIGGDYVVIDGFHWLGGYGASNFIEFREGSDFANYSTIQNCVIDGLALSPDDIADGLEDNAIAKHRWIVLYGTYNTVINCSFLNKNSAGALILVELEYNASPPYDEDAGETATNTRCELVGHTITNNYFYKYAKVDATLSNSGDSETIRVGTSEYQNVNSGTVVNNNYFVEADGENEIITNKSKNNSYINNTFRRCRGSLVLRHGSNATVDGNYFLGEDVEGTGGIRIVDSNHNITNNYIQDCINVDSQAQWNNGITFLGGGDSADVDCSSTNVSNGYQKVENINVSNNTIINTNAPLYYNIEKGSNDPTGIVDNNLIYFTEGDANLTDAITGEYTSLGTALTYTGNVYNGTDLGVTNSGFLENTMITAIGDGEIFTFSNVTDKGANMGAYEPTTDDMVGYGIGACFVDYLGESIYNGDCTIVIGETLTVSSLSILPVEAASYDVTVNANVSWTAVSNDDWISIDTTSGTAGATISVTVTENTDASNRTGSVTFTQDEGGDDIVRVLSVVQEGADLTDLYDLINTGIIGEDPVIIHSFSEEEVDGVTKFNYASNSLDKDNNSVWTADDGDILPGDYKGDGEYVIYDLGSTYTLNLIQFTTSNKSDAFGFQFYVSTTGTEDSDFSMVLPTTGDLLLSATSTTDFNLYEVDTSARYVKVLGFGRFNSDGDSRTSAWVTLGEIEFFGNEVLSVNDFDYDKNVKIYPVPAQSSLTVKVFKAMDIEVAKLYSVEGKLVMDKQVDFLDSEFTMNVSNIENGTYILNLSGSTGINVSKFIVIKN